MAYMTLILVLFIPGLVSGEYYDSKCVQTSTARSGGYKESDIRRYDVTNNKYIITSHDGYGKHFYHNNYERCIDIWANNTDYVIKLKEKKFELTEITSYYCQYDFLKMYYTSMADAEYAEEVYCAEDGPGTKYSTGNHMYLYFYTDSSDTNMGFKFEISSLHKDDIPPSGGAIAGIVIGVLLIIAIIVGVVIFLVYKRNQLSCMRKNQDNEEAAVASGITNNHPTVSSDPPRYSKK